jgi:hypothetical protein
MVRRRAHEPSEDHTVVVTSDGVFLRFESSGGLVAWVNVDVLATEQRTDTAARALTEWCADRRREAGRGTTQ